MPGAFKDKALASKAGSHRNGGKHQKTKQWEALGDFMTQSGAKKAMRIINDLEDVEFLEQYGKLLNYFKPRIQQNNIDFSGFDEINVKGAPPPDEA